ncbi:MAG: GyrI-like domain-containing protein [Clostridium sp.]|uniref:GyrI-like domain-containing protein n=1 Tax=Clostridium sp. TaxID=1506 RepID=UPI003F3193D3
MVITKVDLKKVDKELFNVKKGEFKKVYCDKAYYIAIDGMGNPNENEEYLNKVVSLYKIAYGVKMEYKKNGKDFVVMPLSGLWWSDDYRNFIQDKKEEWKWTMMIQLPEFVEKEDIEKRKKALEKDELYKYIREVRHVEYTEGEAYETLYIGPYSEEGETVQKLHEEIIENGYKLRGKHHEIYLSDPRKTAKEKLKTIIRQGIE